MTVLDFCHAPAALLSFAFQGLVSLRMSLYIKEWELDEIRWKQPLRPMWRSCRNTLETLTLGLVRESCEDDPSSAAAGEDDNMNDEDDGNEDDGNEDDGNEDDGNEDDGNEDDGNEDDGDEDGGDEDDEDEDEGNEGNGWMISGSVNEEGHLGALYAVIGGFNFPRLRGLTLVGWQLDARTRRFVRSGSSSLQKVHFVDGAGDHNWPN